MLNIGFPEMVVIGVVAILLYGKRLPDVARSLGASYKEFRRSLSEIQSQFDLATIDTPSRRTARNKPQRDGAVDYEQPTAPKFEIPPPVIDRRESATAVDHQANADQVPESKTV